MKFQPTVVCINCGDCFILILKYINNNHPLKNSLMLFTISRHTGLVHSTISSTIRAVALKGLTAVVSSLF